MNASRWFRVLLLSLGLVTVLIWPASPSSAAGLHVARVGSSTSQFYGIVTNLTGPADNPTGFTLITRTQAVEFHIAVNTVYSPVSAEAEVEGLSVNDYAIVSARRVHKLWLAYRIQFDVRPIIQNQMTLVGSVTRVVGNSKHFTLKVASGEQRYITVLPSTRFRIFGQLVPGPAILLKGDAVQVLVRRAPTALIAVEINVKSRL